MIVARHSEKWCWGAWHAGAGDFIAHTGQGPLARPLNLQPSSSRQNMIFGRTPMYSLHTLMYSVYTLVYRLYTLISSLYNPHFIYFRTEPWRLRAPKNLDTAHLRTLVPNNLLGIAFGTKVLQWALHGPFWKEVVLVVTKNGFGSVLRWAVCGPFRQVGSWTLARRAARSGENRRPLREGAAPTMPVEPNTTIFMCIYTYMYAYRTILK